MDNTEIIKKGKELAKAAKANASPSILIGLLNELKSGVVATEANLRATSIGSIVNQIRKNPNREIAEVASKIVTQWREAVQRDKNRKEGGGASSSNGTKHSASSGNASPAGASQDKNGRLMEPPAGVDPSLRTHKTDKIDVKPTGNPTRDNCAGLLYNGLVYMSELGPSKILDVAAAVEAQIYKQLGPEEKPAYKAKVRSLFQNLKTKTNTNLRINVASGKITPAQFVTMSENELKSAELKAEEKALSKENMRVAQNSEPVPSVTDNLPCPKCHARKTSFYQQQTRSADEPMTNFCKCEVCSHEWRFS